MNAMVRPAANAPQTVLCRAGDDVGAQGHCPAPIPPLEVGWLGHARRATSRGRNELVMRPRVFTILGLVVVMAVCLSACGDDDEPSASGQNDSSATVEAEAPPAARAFGGLREALEAQGLDVKELPESSLDGAEEGVGISGDKAGSARLFSTEADAKAYADQASELDDATTVVGTVVLQSTSQENTQFFVDAYEG
jgi:hypothetical protein